MSSTMQAMVMAASGRPLEWQSVPKPQPARGEIRVRVHTCAVCRTDLHVVDGDLDRPKLPLIPGHEIIGTVDAIGPGVPTATLGERVGVPWLGFTCGACKYCQSGHENLCNQAQFTGYTRDGGFAEHVAADHRFCFPIPEDYTDVAAAPLMCAGLIGYRSLLAAEKARRLGVYGFGAAAHIVTQVARSQGREVYAFTKPGDTETQDFARNLGAVWAAGSDEPPPRPLDAAIIFAPVGALVPVALRNVDKGGIVVCAGIHMTEIPAFPYHILWEERMIRSVANLTRADGEAFLRVAPKVPVETVTIPYPLRDANKALDDLRHGRFEGAAVLVVTDHGGA